MLPNSNASQDKEVTYHTYRAQLMFGLKPTKAGVNVAQLFNDWFIATSKALGNFSTVSFEEAERVANIVD